MNDSAKSLTSPHAPAFPPPSAPQPAQGFSEKRAMQQFQVADATVPDGNSLGDGWFETRQQLERDWSVEATATNKRKCFGFLSLQVGLMAFMVLSLAVASLEIFAMVSMLRTAMAPIPPSEPTTGAGQTDDPSADMTWMWGQIVWYSASLVACIVGLVALAREHLLTFRGVMYWMFPYTFVFFVLSIMFMNSHPGDMLRTPALIVLSMLVSIINVYACYCAVLYARRLDAMAKIKARPTRVIGTIAGPV
ncbi:hypothetical protein RI367_004924 [Sorochytrium milnesiophthora]